MGSEISFSASDVDIDGFTAALHSLTQDESDLRVTVTEIPFTGRARTVWGRVLEDGDEDAWAEAHMEADAGDSTIELISPASGAPPFVAAVLVDRYLELTLPALCATGLPYFDYATTFVQVEIAFEGTEFALSFDRSTRATGGPSRFLPEADETGAALITDHDGWHTLRGTAADHIRVIRILDVLRSHATVRVHDSSHYDEHRDELALVASMAFDRQLRADLREALETMPADLEQAMVRRHTPVLTIARLLGEDGCPG